jgi:lipase ATG15
VEGALMNKSVYFQAAVDLYDDIVRMYPHSQIWLAGHSLGAALAGILGVTFGIPAVGFEAPGDLLPAQRLHLPLPPGANFGKGQEMSHVFQVFHTADPIAMGTCNGALSSCSVAGYALETRCHLGQSIIFGKPFRSKVEKKHVLIEYMCCNMLLLAKQNRYCRQIEMGPRYQDSSNPNGHR